MDLGLKVMNDRTLFWEGINSCILYFNIKPMLVLEVFLSNHFTFFQTVTNGTERRGGKGKGAPTFKVVFTAVLHLCIVGLLVLQVKLRSSLHNMFFSFPNHSSSR